MSQFVGWALLLLIAVLAIGAQLAFGYWVTRPCTPIEPRKIVTRASLPGEPVVTFEEPVSIQEALSAAAEATDRPYKTSAPLLRATFRRKR